MINEMIKKMIKARKMISRIIKNNEIKYDKHFAKSLIKSKVK